MRGILLVFFGCVLAATSSAQAQKNNIIPDSSGTIICVFPANTEFPGGIDSFRSYIKRNLRWPGNGYDDHEGRVIVTFIVEKSGKLTHIKVVRGVSPAIDKEAIRLIKNSPKWKPAIENNKPKRVSYSLPIAFNRSED